MKYNDFKQMSFSEMQSVLGGYANPVEGGGTCNYTKGNVSCSCGSGWIDCKCQANDPVGGHCIGSDSAGNCYQIGMGGENCPKTS